MFSLPSTATAPSPFALPCLIVISPLRQLEHSCLLVVVWRLLSPLLSFLSFPFRPPSFSLFFFDYLSQALFCHLIAAFFSLSFSTIHSGGSGGGVFLLFRSLLPVLEFTPNFPATFPALSSPCFLPSQFSVASTSSAVAAAAACAQCADSTVLCSLCCCDSRDLLTIHTTRVCVARLSPVHSLPVHCQCSLMWSQ